METKPNSYFESFEFIWNFFIFIIHCFTIFDLIFWLGQRATISKHSNSYLFESMLEIILLTDYAFKLLMTTFDDQYFHTVFKLKFIFKNW